MVAAMSMWALKMTAFPLVSCFNHPQKGNQLKRRRGGAMAGGGGAMAGGASGDAYDVGLGHSHRRRGRRVKLKGAWFGQRHQA